MKSQPTEHAEQVAFVQWWRRTQGHRILAIPNGGQRSAIIGAKMKAEGVARGVPDLYIPALRVWIEMKRQRGGSVSPEQRDWHDYLRSVGDVVLVAKGFDDAVTQITPHLSPASSNPQL